MHFLKRTQGLSAWACKPIVRLKKGLPFKFEKIKGATFFTGRFDITSQISKDFRLKTCKILLNIKSHFGGVPGRFFKCVTKVGLIREAQLVCDLADR